MSGSITERLPPKALGDNHEKIWAKLEPEIEFRSRQALTALLDREQAKPRQLSLFD